ncbi:hypothetical protein AHAS_Ahas02G0258400 [Arachis hypogaea]
MEKKQKIVQYRERLDRTLASPDLTNDEMLKRLVESQLLKQDTDEFRVMYREGPEGTPFHTLLVEGYVDAPLDVCLCISWEASLYKKWWPQSTVPTFKILACECLHKVRIGEQISLVRMKVSWPLSMREAIVYYYLFEYFQDDLIVVLTNSVPESNGVNSTINGLNEVIPEAKDVVRVDLVGGFALQKVTSERSYFRTIANMDIKLDFVPPSLINFISRQLIGNGFRLYKKTVASMMSHGEEELSKALGDPLYVRIRESLYSSNGSKAKVNEELELKQDADILPAEEDLIESKQDKAKVAAEEDKSNRYANSTTSMVVNGVVADSSKTFSEIIEVDSEEIIQIAEEDKEVNDIPKEEVDISVLKSTKSVYISSEVAQALETLDKAISVVRQYKLHSRTSSFSFPTEKPPSMNNDGWVDLHSAEFTSPSSRNEVAVEVTNRDIPEGTSQEATSINSDFRYTGTNSNSNAVDSNIPTSPEKRATTPALSKDMNLTFNNTMLKKKSSTLFTILRHTTPSVPKKHSPLTFSSHSNNPFLHTSSPPPPFSPKGHSFHNPTWFYSFGYLTLDGRRLCSKSAEIVKERSSRCWNCHESTAAAAPFLVCDSCRCIQPVDDSIDYFEIFGLEKKYDIEGGVNLEGKYKDWQKKLHPDLVHSKSQKERDFAAEQSARVIDAYRTLSKPLSRAIYMMKLDGLEVDEEQTISDPELLAEIMEIREAVEEATESESLKQILSRMEENLRSWSNTFATAFQSRNFEEAKDSIRRMTYYSRVIDEVVKKL